MADDKDQEIADLKARLAALEQRGASPPPVSPNPYARMPSYHDPSTGSVAQKRKGGVPVWVWIVGGLVLLVVIGNIAAQSSGSHGAATDPTAAALRPGESPAQADFERVNPKFLAAVVPCYMGFQRTADAIHQGDRYGAYDIAQAAKQACLTAFEDADATQFSAAMPEPARDKLNADLKACSDAYAQEDAALESIATVLNGDERPSTVSTEERNIAIATSEVTSCMTSYTADLKAAGLALPGDAPQPATHHHHSHA